MKNKKIGHSHLKDLMILAILAAAAAGVSWWFPINFFESMLLFFVPPALYLNYHSRRSIKRNLLFAVVATVGGVGVDYAAVADHAWSVPTIFPLRLFGLVPVEDVLWFFLLTYLILSYFGHFYDRLPHRIVGRRMPYLYLIVVVMSAAWILLTLLSGHAYDITYFYLKGGILFCALPLMVFLLEFPRFMSTFLATMPYFTAISLLEEIVSLHKGYWSFPGNHFIGWISLGAYSFPVEELVFWIILFSSVVLAYFEFFDDNRLKLRWHKR